MCFNLTSLFLWFSIAKEKGKLHKYFDLNPLSRWVLQKIAMDSTENCVHLTSEELTRYSRHLTLPEVGLDGQLRLKAAKVLCIGVGGLGSPVALYLSAAGVGTLGLVEADRVDLSNLQRQVLFTSNDLAKSKLHCAAAQIEALNPNIKVQLHEAFLNSENAQSIVANYDLIIDGTDNFPTRYLTNDIAGLLRKPLVYGSVFRFEGQATVFAPHLGGPCYRCLFPEPPPVGSIPNCAEGGVLGVVPGMIGMMQSLEAIKLITGIGTPLIGRMLYFDALKTKFREFQLTKDPACPLCGDHPTLTQLIDYKQFCAGSMQLPEIPSLSVQELKQKQDASSEAFVLIDVREPFEYEIARIPGAQLIPLQEFGEKMETLDRDKEIILHCKSGGRSAMACKALLQLGFENVKNLTGGIRAWSEEIDPTVPIY